LARQPKTNTEINGYNYFRTRLNVGFDNKGNPIRKTFYGRTKTEAENKKNEYVRALENGLNPDLSSQSLERSMHAWLWDIEYHSGNKSSTFERYESIYRNYVQDTTLGQLIVNNIKKIAIQKYYNDLIKNGKSHSVVLNLNKLLNKFFSYAESESYILKNPIKGLKISKGNEEDIKEDIKSIETFSKEEINIIINSLGNVKIRYIIIFALLTGAREGEILALEKSDIQNNIVKINKSARLVKVFKDDSKYSYELKITKPKSKNSNREIPLPRTLINELSRLDILIKEEKLKLGPAYNDNNLLFPSLTGQYIDSRNLIRSWKRVLNNAGVQYRKFHSLRHTYATKLFENGSSILTVSRLLGHSSIKTTEIYTHVLEDIKEKEVQCLNSIFI
jgi:integrase